MANPGDVRRRRLGLFCLVAAAGMLIAGQTALKPHLDGLTFVFYWLGCFGFTIGAICIALMDVRAVGRRLRNEHQALIQKTLEEVEREQRAEPED